MRGYLRVFVAMLLVASVANVCAKDSSVDSGDGVTQVQIDVLKLQYEQKIIERELAEQARRVESEVKVFDKSVSALSLRNDAQDKRIEDHAGFLSGLVSVIGLLLSFLAIVLTVAGVAGYITVRRKASDEAKAVAQEETSKWFERRSSNLELAVVELNKKLEALESEADARYKQHRDRMREMEEGVDLARRNIQARLGNEPAEPMSMEASLALAESARVAKAKPEAERSFVDWNNTAFEAYRNSDKISAVESWLAASKAAGASAEERSGALYNAALALTELNKIEDAIHVYDEIYHEFASETSERARLNFARAMLNRGVLLSRVARYDDAKATYLDLITRLDSEMKVEFEEQLAKSMLSLSFLYAKTRDRVAEFSEYDRLIAKFGGRSESSLQLVVAMALVNYGVAMQRSGDAEMGRGKYNQVVEMYGSVQDELVRVQLVKAMLGMAHSFEIEGRRREEVEWYDNIVSEFSNEASDSILQMVVHALAKKAVALYQLGDASGALDVYGLIREKFSSGMSPGVGKEVSVALFNEGILLHKLERFEAELLSYDDVLSRIDRGVGQEYKRLLASVLINKANVLGALGRNAEKIAVCDEILSRYEQDDESDSRDFIMDAMLYRADAMIEAGKQEDGLREYFAIIDRFGAGDDESARRAVLAAKICVAREYAIPGENQAGRSIEILDEVLSEEDRYRDFENLLLAARIGRGFASVILAKERWSDISQRENLLHGAMKDFEAAVALGPEDYIGWQNSSYCLYLLNGEVSEVIEMLRKALNLGAGEAFEAAISDTKIHPIAVLDESFESIVEREWSKIRQA